MKGSGGGGYGSSSNHHHNHGNQGSNGNQHEGHSRHGGEQYTPVGHGGHQGGEQHSQGGHGYHHGGEQYTSGGHGSHHGGEPHLQSRSNHLSSSAATYSPSMYSTDRSEIDEDEGFLDDDDEVYLRPGEPYGAFLLPVEDPYIRAVKIEEANRDLFRTPLRDRRTTTKVRIMEEYNRYYDNYDEDYDVIQEEPFDFGRGREIRRNHPYSSSQGDYGGHSHSSR